MNLILRLATGILLTLASPTLAALKEGDAAPSFELTLIDGSKVASADMRGQVIVLNFWATWCAPCREELPLLDAYYALSRQHGLRMFAITTEDSLPIIKLRTLFSHMNMPSVRKVKGPFKALDALPTNYVIDRAGRIRYAKAGAFTLDHLNELIVPLLNEKAPAS